MQQSAYIYARLGLDDRMAVLRLPVSGQDQPYPGGDSPTTRSVGPLVIDSTRAQNEARVAVEEGWQQPPSDDPWVSCVHEMNGGEHGVSEANINQGEQA